MRRAWICVLMAGLLWIMACGGGTIYTISTAGGKQYVTNQEPKLDSDHRTYTFTTLEGDTIILNQKEVTEIKGREQ